MEREKELKDSERVKEKEKQCRLVHGGVCLPRFNAKPLYVCVSVNDRWLSSPLTQA